jgi:hypothetical protein
MGSLLGRRGTQRTAGLRTQLQRIADALEHIVERPGAEREARLRERENAIADPPRLPADHAPRLIRGIGGALTLIAERHSTGH